jgi:hypothetical protein
MWSKALEDAGFKKGDFLFKEIRHLANTELKNANVVVEKRRAMTGHRSNEANEVYTHPSGDDTLEAGQALSEFGPDEF